MTRRACSHGLLALTIAAALASGCFSKGTNPDNEPLDPSAWARKVRLQMVPGALNMGAVIFDGAPDADAAIMAAEQLTAAGGVGGRPVHVVYLTNNDYPSGTLDATIRGMIAAGLPVILTSTSGDTLLSFADGSPAGVLSLASGSTAPALTSVTRPPDLLFRTCPADATKGGQADILAAVAFDEVTATATSATPTAAVIFQEGDAYSEGLRDAFAASFSARGGIVQGAVGLSFDQGLTEDSLNAAVASVFRQGALPDKVLLATQSNPDPATSVVIAWGRAGFPRKSPTSSPWIFPDALVVQVFVNNLPAAILAALDGTTGVSLAPGVGTGFTVFAQDFRARFAAGDPTPFVANAYDAVALVGLAAQRAATVEQQSVPSGTAIARHLREVAGPSGAPVSPGVSSLAVGLSVLASGGQVDYQGAYTAFRFNDSGDMVGQAAFEVFRLSASRRAYTSVRTIQATIGP